VRETVQRGLESVRRGARQEGRRVMVILLEAAARLAPPSLEDALQLADRLLGALMGGRLLERKDQLNGRLHRLLEALAEKRYGKVVRLEKSPEKQERRGSEEAEGPPPSGTGSGPVSPAPGPEASPDASSGPDLPAKFEDFQALVDRAFFAPDPAPSPQHEFRPLMDLIGQTLWERTHVFEKFVKEKKQQLGHELEALGKSTEWVDLAERGKRIMEALAAEVPRQQVRSFAHDTRQRLATLMALRYGPDRAIEAFSERPHDDCVA
jgi:hypothetical protein